MMYLYETVEIAFLINLIVAFWNCCLALFKSSLRSPEQSRYRETCKIHGAKRGSHDRRSTDFGTVICPCRPIEVIAVSAVNSAPTIPITLLPSHIPLLFFSPCLHLTLALILQGPASSLIALVFRIHREIRKFHRILWNDLTTKTTIYLSRAHWPHTRCKHNRSKAPMPVSQVRPSIRDDRREPPC